MRSQSGGGARQRRRIGLGRERQHFAHQRAQVSVFPVLDPPVREAKALVTLESLPPQLGDFAATGQPVARDGESIAQRTFSICLCQYNIHHDIRFKRQAASSNCAYPEASSCSASSLSPLFTTRPLDITCTKSGTT